MTLSSIPSSPVEFLELQRLQQAKEQGFALFAIRPEDGMPGFAYTIGMAQHELPELLVYFNSEEQGKQVMGLMTNICNKLIKGLNHFDRVTLLRAFVHKEINASDPDVVYFPKFLTGESYRYAMEVVITRAVRYRKELGVPTVIELQHDGVLSIDAVRASQMLADS